LSAVSRSIPLLSDLVGASARGRDAAAQAVATCMALMPVPVETRATVCTGKPERRAISIVPSSP
jgi:hypothetical protein